MGRFVDCKTVLQACQGKVLVVAGEKDKLMTESLMKRMADEYEAAASKGSRGKGNVAFGVVKGSGHHMQNDLMWEDAAGIVREWLEDVD